jgi:hypothetical protein
MTDAITFTLDGRLVESWCPGDSGHGATGAIACLAVMHVFGE